MSLTTKLSDIDDETRGTGGRPRLYQTRTEQTRAYRQRRKQRAAYPPLPPGPYRVLYADPPWQYANDGLKNYGHAASHYATLSIDALCQLPVKAIMQKDAVLFLWVTAPMSLACAPVISAWGFTFKTSLIWDKMRHNFGYYVGVQHELLYVCTRGRCRPDIHDLPGSVRRIPRADHSTKPPAFRHLIDMLYHEGRRLELFARERSAQWDTWGNNVREVSDDGDGHEHEYSPRDSACSETS